MNKGGRPRKIPEESTVIPLRVEDRVIAGYDAWVKEIHAEVFGGEAITRADLMRAALAEALEKRLSANRKKTVRARAKTTPRRRA